MRIKECRKLFYYRLFKIHQYIKVDRKSKQKLKIDLPFASKI